MKYALVVENNAITCNGTSAILASLGYLVTPTFSLRKALHAVRMIQFDLIVTWTVANPDDRRALTGEFKRHSPHAILILVADGDANPSVNGHLDGIDAVVHRPLTARDIRTVVESSVADVGLSTAPSRSRVERRKCA
jgi:PleD family two-component response regulator